MQVTTSTRRNHIVSVTLLFLLFAVPAFPAIFTWTDASGTVHFTDNRAGIPPRYRKQAVSRGSSAPEPQNTPPAPVTAARLTPPPLRPATEEPASRSKEADQAAPSELDSLAAALMEKATSDRDRAYAIFCWIHDNIRYDNATKWQRRYGNAGADQSPEGVLAARRGVCAGLANLFTALAGKMGLESVVVTGRASGMRQEAHAWNAVKVDGAWGLVDLTRHSFLNPPEEFLDHHFPNDPQWQLLDRPLTYEEWLKR